MNTEYKNITINTADLQYVDSRFYKKLGIKLLAEHHWDLFYYQGKYHAGCRGPWSAEEALKHWDEYHHYPERAMLFTKAIIEHEKSLTN